MKQITVVSQESKGALANIAYLLGKARVNIDVIYAEASGGKGIINLMVDDEKKAEEVLKNNGYKLISGEVLIIKLNDTPGALSEVTKKLAKAKVNIESVYLISRESGYCIDALMVDKPKKAKKVLAEYLLNNPPQ